MANVIRFPRPFRRRSASPAPEGAPPARSWPVACAETRERLRAIIRHALALLDGGEPEPAPVRIRREEGP